jgi:hypothetical protein
MTMSLLADTTAHAKKRPVSLTIVACLYIALGSIGFAYHLQPIIARHGFDRDDLLVEFIEIVAIVAGGFILRGENWARWLAVAWIAFHVFISFFDSLPKVTMHALFFLLIAYFLFRPKAGLYFQRPDETGT